MKRRIRYDQIEVIRFEPHLPRIAHLEKGAVTKLPSGCGCSGTVDHCRRGVDTDRVKVLVLPEHFQRNQSNTRADVQDHADFVAEPESALNEVIFDLCGIFPRSRIDEGIDLFVSLQFGRFDPRGMEQAREQTH